MRSRLWVPLGVAFAVGVAVCFAILGDESPRRPVRAPRVISDEVRALNGVYRLPRDAFFQAEDLILEDGDFRYWFASDVILPTRPKFPIRGHYFVRDGMVTFDLSSEPQWGEPTMHRTVGELNGLRVLWRDDGLAHYRETGRVHPYGVLVRVGPPSAWTPERPSCELIGVTPPARPR